MDIVAQGFLGRNTLLRSPDELQFSLWPKDSPTGLDEHTSFSLVYSASACPAQPTGAVSLRRVNSDVREVAIHFASGLQDRRAEDRHRVAIERLSAAVGRLS
jgi:hypothetical protein